MLPETDSVKCDIHGIRRGKETSFKLTKISKDSKINMIISVIAAQNVINRDTNYKYKYLSK